MPQASWQRKAKALRPERRKFPPVAAGVPCGLCDDVRSSHSMILMYSRCHAAGCDCLAFDPRCGCGDLLSDHAWDTPPDHWACARCICKGFGARMPAESQGRLF